MKKRDYPQQKTPYIVKVKSGQSTDSWRDFDTARLQVSVGQEYHEGDKFSSLVSWCTGRFNKISICANDTLQRFNMMFEQGIEEDEAQATSSKIGAEWVERAMPVIEGIEKAHIIRWDEWKAQTQFSKGRMCSEWLYANNNEFKAAIDQNINDIWSRRKKTDPVTYNDKNYEGFRKLSRSYLLEETTVFAQMFNYEEAIDIYPGTALFAATLFRGRDVQGAPDGFGKGHFCRVDFAKNRNYTPK